MKKIQLPATTYPSRCNACGTLSSFSQFEASFYDFDTYWGTTTGTLYRLNLELTDLKYGSVSVEAALAPAVDREGGRKNLQRIPDELACSSCRAVDLCRVIETGTEEKVDAVELPPR